MTFTINTITRPAACDHFHFNVTINGTTKTVVVRRQDIMEREPDENFEELTFAHIRSHLKENNITTLAQAKTALEGKTFKL